MHWLHVDSKMAQQLLSLTSKANRVPVSVGPGTDISTAPIVFSAEGGPIHCMNHHMGHIFITGATGCLGSELLPRLLRDTRARITVLLRDTRGGRRAIERLRSDRDADRVECLVGDVVDARLGLPQTTWARLGHSVDEVWHLAAVTRFEDLLGPHIEKVNSVGTAHALHFAAQNTRLRCFHHMSTAYVAGRMAPGAVAYERIAAEDAVFRNPYEASKREAELRVAASGLPHVIYRPSIVLGNPDFGSDAAQTVYGVAKMARLAKLMGMRAGDPVEAQPFRVLGAPSAVKNIVPSSAVVEALMRLRAAAPESGTVFHIANPDPPTMDDLVESVAKLLGLRHCVLLPHLDLGDATVAERSFQRMARPYKSYMLDSDPVFDMRNVLAAIGPVPMPRVRPAYLKECIRRFLVGVYGVNFDGLPLETACSPNQCLSMP